MPRVPHWESGSAVAEDLTATPDGSWTLSLLLPTDTLLRTIVYYHHWWDPSTFDNTDYSTLHARALVVLYRAADGTITPPENPAEMPLTQDYLWWEQAHTFTNQLTGVSRYHIPSTPPGHIDTPAQRGPTTNGGQVVFTWGSRPIFGSNMGYRISWRVLLLRDESNI